MASLPPPAATRATATGSRFATILTGCAIGCAGLLAILVIAVVLMVQWVSRAEPLPAPGAFLDPDVKGYLEMTGDPENPGSMQFISALAAEGQGDQRLLEKALPVRFVGVIAGDAAAPRYFGVLSLSHYANMLRLTTFPLRLASTDSPAARRYREQTIFQDSHGKGTGSFAIVGGSLLFASGEDGARTAIDRLLDPGTGKPSPELLELLPTAPGIAVRGALVNRDGELLRLLTRLGFPWAQSLPPASGAELEPASPASASAPPAPPAAPGELDPARLAAVQAALGAVRGVSLRIQPGAPEPSAAEGSVELFYDGDAAVHLEGLRLLGPPLAAWLGEHGVAPVVELRAEGSKLRLEGRLEGLASALGGRAVKIGPVEVK